MADNISVTQGAGKTVATDEVVDGTLGTVQVQFVKLMDGTLDGTNKLIVNSDGSLNVKLETQSIEIGKVDQGTAGTLAGAWPVELSDGTNLIGVTAHPVRTDPTGTTTQPISGTVTANAGTNLNTSALALDTTLTGGTQQTKIVQGGNTAVVDATGDLQVDVNNFPATQTVAGTVTANAGTGNFTVVQATGTNLHAVIDSGSTTTVTGNVTVVQPTGTNLHTVLDSGTLTSITNAVTVSQPTAANLNATVTVANPVIVQSCLLVQSATAATGTGVTVTLPAVAGQFHYISFIEIVKYFTVANAASATPLVVTTTNLPGSLAFTFGQPLGTIGTTDRMIHDPNSPIHSSTVNTATTIVCPATTGIIWRVNVYYFAAA